MDQDRGQHSKAPGVPGNDSSGVGQRLRGKGERSGHTTRSLFYLYRDAFRQFGERHQYTACFAGKQYWVYSQNVGVVGMSGIGYA